MDIKTCRHLPRGMDAILFQGDFNCMQCADEETAKQLAASINAAPARRSGYEGLTIGSKHGQLAILCSPAMANEVPNRYAWAAEVAVLEGSTYLLDADAPTFAGLERLLDKVVAAGSEPKSVTVGWKTMKLLQEEARQDMPPPIVAPSTVAGRAWGAEQMAALNIISGAEYLALLETGKLPEATAPERIGDQIRECYICGKKQKVDDFTHCLEGTEASGEFGDDDDLYICEEDYPRLLAALMHTRAERQRYRMGWGIDDATRKLWRCDEDGPGIKALPESEPIAHLDVDLLCDDE